MIKLLKIEQSPDGTERFCTQLQIGKGVASFIREKNGDMKQWTKGKDGWDFYSYNDPYQIVECASDMKFQPL
jgi:hypothetical protein